MQSTSEAKALVLANACKAMKDTIERWDVQVLAAEAKGQDMAYWRERMQHIRTVLATAEEFPAIIILSSASEWMKEEIEARKTLDFLTSLKECEILFNNASTNEQMAPLGIIVWMLNEMTQ